jgi:hydrogenase expression/formation protein HypC
MCLAIPGQVVELVDEDNRLAKVEVGGVRRNVNVGLLDEDGGIGARPGDWVLIHVGFALSKVDEGEAQATLALLQQMGEAYEQELEDLKASVIE